MAVSQATQLIMTQHMNDINNVMSTWVSAKRDLENAKTKELAYRNAVFELQFPTPKEGTNRVELGNGYHLKSVAKLNYRVDPIKAEPAMEKLSKTGNEGAFLADRIFKWSADIVISEYRKLEPTYKQIVDECLTITPGTPSLEIEEPKAAK